MTLAGRGLCCIRSDREVFRNLDFDLVSGQALVLRGPNGSGKTSLLRLVAGLLQPAAGKLTWDGVSVEEDPEAHRTRLHYVGHLDSLKPAFSVAENLAFWAALRGNPGGETAALERFGIARLADFPAGLLSAGQRRRLALARLAASAAPLWLLDEPTVALDTEAIGALAELIAEHRETGGMVLAATHVDLPLSGADVMALDRFKPGAAS
jgi:heme exporter protein A